ncbi:MULTISPECIES: hypothetical protein [unclassified Cryobacterium]|uniref:hypothetical protein n=1 Tax=unclassified Cryobacterium TaxID=2649013 RepID=UPI00106BBF4B|nr:MULTISPECIES: hypothetical protein [unclassified Cryobacterium]TFC59440.1 hypothetical protein E3O68_00640 [Cryobacterium sp. TMB3-1-2]TFC67236.1 hypothetical protein E3T21_17335 [Cryobacterium sp. TMB3-15]TFC73251.1 hypothetical protein E3T22_16720 [Cryobacterium sp. TMB3-10]TFD46139.1 hypothetical protein E3T58_01355 [Cryobacterium sp. TMB3-12]
MAQTLTDLITRLEKATIDLDDSRASNAVRKLVVDFREFDKTEEPFFEIISPTPRRHPGY